MNDQFYCVWHGEDSSDCPRSGYEECDSCRGKHHKWPTPVQFRKEYGREVPDDIPVWSMHGNFNDDSTEGWHLSPWKNVKEFMHITFAVIACTPFGKPSNDYLPEEEE